MRSTGKKYRDGFGASFGDVGRTIDGIEIPKIGTNKTAPCIDFPCVIPVTNDDRAWLKVGNEPTVLTDFC